MIEVDNSDQNHWKIKGPLVLSQLSSAKKLFEIKGPINGDWEIDLSGITQLDCAGLAYILQCVRSAETNQLKIKLLNLEEKYFRLIDVYGVSELLSPLFDGRT